MSKYLVDERPLTVLPTLAAVYGLTEAVILQEVHWLINQPRSGKALARVEMADGRVFINRVWVWNTAQQWVDYFGWLKPDTIRKHFASLESRLAMVSCQPNDRDRTKYYTIDYDAHEANIAEWLAGKECRIQSEKDAGCNRHGLRSLQSEKDAGSSIKQRRQAEKTAEGEGAKRPARPIVEAPPSLQNQKPPNNKRPAWMGPTEPDPRISAWRAFTTNAPLNKIQEDAILTQVTDCALGESILKTAMLYHSRANVAKFLGYYAAGNVPNFSEVRTPKGAPAKTAAESWLDAAKMNGWDVEGMTEGMVTHGN